MNTMRLLIIATFTCLTAAIVYFYITNGQQESLADLEKRLQQARIAQATKNMLVPLTPTPSTFSPPAYSPPAQPKVLTPEEVKRQADEAEQALLAAEKARAEEAKALQQAEIAKRSGGDNKDRQWLISNALLQATVNEYDAKSGILIINLLPNHNLVPGQVIGIRRNNGIIGRITVARIDDYKTATADPIAGSFFGGNIDIKIGDELIVVP